MAEAPLTVEVEKRLELSFVSSVIGIVSCALIVSTFVFPWYESNYFRNSAFDFSEEYSLTSFTRDGERFSYPAGDSELASVGDTMGLVFWIMIVALAISIVALAMSSLERRVSGVVAGALSAAMLMIVTTVFYFGMIDDLRLDGFNQMTHWNKTMALDTGPELSYFIVVALPAVQAAQAIFLAYSGSEE